MVLSLLRLGDWIQSLPLLAEIQKSIPAIENLHVVLQEAAKSAAPLNTQFHYSFFPRQKFAAELVEMEGSPTIAIKDLRQWIQKLIDWSPERIIDLHPTESSQALIKYLQQRMNVQVHAWDPAYKKYLNQNWLSDDHPAFTWSDLQAALLGFQSPPVQEERLSTGRMIALQPFTSDAKKNWDLQKWKALAVILKEQGFQLQILLSPNEAARFQEEGPSLEDEQRVCSLVDAKEILEAASLLISGDTSILHLAALTGTPSIGLFLGPANKYKICPRLVGCWIFETKKSEALSIEQVLRLVQAKLRSEPLAELSTPAVSIVTAGVFNRLSLKEISLNEVTTHQGGSVNLAKRRALDQVVWGFYLDQKYDDSVPPYGSAVQELQQIGSFLQSDVDPLRELHHSLNAAEDLLEILSESLLKYSRSSMLAEAQPEAPQRYWDQLIKMSQSLSQFPLVSDSARNFLQALKSSQQAEASFFERTRKVKEGLTELALLFQIQRKMINVLINKLNERSHRVSRTRELPQAGYRPFGETSAQDL